MIKALIIDDEVRASDALRLMIEKFTPAVNQVSVCNDARLAAEMIRQTKPDLVFLDIKMPHLSGFELLQKIPRHQFKLVFTTAFNEFAIKAIRFSAFDYLLKPVDVEELISCINRYMETDLKLVDPENQYRNMLHNLQAPEGQFRLAVPSREGIYYLEPADIMYCEAQNNYTRFYSVQGKQFLASRTLGDYEELLSPHGMIRCHKSILVNKKFVSYIDQDGMIILRNGIRLEVSKRRKAEVMKKLSLSI